MKKTIMLLCVHIFVCLLILTGTGNTGWAKTKAQKKSGSTGLQQRIDFGNAYIMGQSIKSGAVYLLHRKQSNIESMLQYRENYRQEILEDFIVKEDNPYQTQNAEQKSEVSQKPNISK